MGEAHDVSSQGALSSALGSLRDVLRNRGIRRIELAWTTGTAADWAFLVVLLVVAYDAGGALGAGILAAVRVVPAIVAAPFATSLVERFRGDRVLTGINLVRAAGAVATAGVVGGDLPIELTYVLAGLVAGAGALVRPIQTALLPAFARTPRELVAANVASSTGEAVGTFAGPLLAALLVAVTGSMTASLLVAGAFAAAAAAVTGISFEHEADAWGGSTSEPTRVFRMFAALPRMTRQYRAASWLIGGFAAQVFVRGLLITFLVVASIELLDMGDTGVGYLNAAIGLGGLAGAAGALALRTGSRLGAVALLSLAAWGLPLVAIGAWPSPAVALGALFVTGFANCTLDVSGFTLVQRGVANEDRVTVFGLMESLFGLALFLGSLVAPALLALLGTRGSFAVAGIALPFLAALMWHPVLRGVRASARRETHVALLRRNPLFAPLPLTALDLLAESLQPVSYGAGEIVMRQGEPGSEYVLIAEGEVEVSDNGNALGVCGPGEGVGEIGLLRQVPRTATVAARTPVSAYVIDGPTFLAAVAGPAASAAAQAVASTRLQRSAAIEKPPAKTV